MTGAAHPSDDLHQTDLERQHFAGERVIRVEGHRGGIDVDDADRGLLAIGKGELQPVVQFRVESVGQLFPLDFEYVYYVTTPDYAAYMDVQQAIQLDLISRFAVEGIEFAYPTRQVVVTSMPTS